MNVTLERTNDLPLAFDGELVAEASSHHPAKDRWTELRLYRIDAGGYVLESVGLSCVAGEVTLRNATACPTVPDVVRHLQKSDASREGGPRPYLTDLAWELLRAAQQAGAIPTVETV